MRGPLNRGRLKVPMIRDIYIYIYMCIYIYIYVYTYICILSSPDGRCHSHEDAGDCENSCYVIVHHTIACHSVACFALVCYIIICYLIELSPCLFRSRAPMENAVAGPPSAACQQPRERTEPYKS